MSEEEPSKEPEETAVETSEEGGEASEEVSEEVSDEELMRALAEEPLDEEIVLRAAAETGAIVTAEEATVIGGLGGAVAELLSEKRPTPVVKLGVNDVFGKSGPAKELVVLFGFTAENIAAKAKAAIALK